MIDAEHISISPDALFQEVGGEGVILDLASSRYFGLDGVGLRFWQLIHENSNPQIAYAALLDEFDVSEEQLKRDLQKLVDQLTDAGLIRVG